MPLTLDVKPQLNEDFADQVAVAVRKAFGDTLVDLIQRLTYTDDERALIERYRRIKVADRRGAHESISDALLRQYDA